MKLTVGIDCVYKIYPMYFPMTNSKTNNVKGQYYGKHNIITKSKFGNIQIINIMMYVSIIFYV